MPNFVPGCTASNLFRIFVTDEIGLEPVNKYPSYSEEQVLQEV